MSTEINKPVLKSDEKKNDNKAVPTPKARRAKGTVQHQKINVDAMLDEVVETTEKSERYYGAVFRSVYNKVRKSLVILQKARTGAHTITNKEAVERAHLILSEAIEECVN